MPKRTEPEPSNLSRAAGAPAPASAAATAPFYAGEEGGAAPGAGSALAAAAATFTEQARLGAVPVDEHTTADEDTAGAAAATERETLEQAIARIRSVRKPLGSFSQKLALEERRGYKRHWFNDSPGRVDEALANGWAHVLDKDKKPIRRCVGRGRDNGALFAYAMELPAVFWEEDMAAKHADASSRVEALKTRVAVAPKDGAAQASDKGKFYDPKEDEHHGQATPVQIVRPGARQA